MNYIIKHVTKYPNKGPKHRLDLDSSQLTVYSFGSFSGNEDGSFQVGYKIFLTDKHNNANLIYYASIKSRLVVKSVLGVETFALADACNAAILIQYDLQIILVINRYDILMHATTGFDAFAELWSVLSSPSLLNYVLE